MATGPAFRTDDETLHWLALRLTPGLGPRRSVELLGRFGSPQNIFRASATELSAAGLPGTLARSLASGCAFEEASEQQEKIKRGGIQLVALSDPLYPAQLRSIFDPPPLLFARGRLDLLETLMLGIVGSRRASPYGLNVAERLARELAVAGLTIVSGMARGIDTAAHNGALSAGGGTIAVFGCGLDIIYPAENRKLSERIAAEGLLVSEFPLGAPAQPQNFPIRNRVVSGLSEGVVVVEGVEYSGSLVTARLALDQNREVFAVPGNITSPLSFSPNLLIKQGAHLVQSAVDVVDSLSWEARKRLARQQTLPLEPLEAAPTHFDPMAGVHEKVISLLKVDEPVQLDALLEKVYDVSSSEVINSLFELELAGRVRQLPGRSYVKVWQE